jgi:hypothetical protein
MRIPVPLSLVAGAFVLLPLSLGLAQNSTNNPDNMGGTSGSQVANPQRPSGASNPALTTGTLPRSADSTIPSDKNPNVGGATGHTVVPGSNASISGDKKQTVGKKTGSGPN